MTSEFELGRREKQAAAQKAIMDLLEHMGEVTSFQFELDDGRLVKVSVSKASSRDAAEVPG